MKFEYLVLADAANNGPDGKLNVLGMGVRVLSVGGFPALSPVVVLGSVIAPIEEAGEYEVQLDVVTPGGTVEPLFRGRATMSGEVRDERVPTGLGFAVGLVRPYAEEGLYRVLAHVGEATAEYEYVVRIDPGLRSAAEAVVGRAASGATDATR